MTSASELFHNRRSRIGRSDPELGFGSSSSSIDRSLPLPIPSHHHHSDRRRSRHHHHHQHQHHRREIEDSDQVRRSSSNSRHFCHREHETVRFEHGANQFSTRNSGGSGTSGSRANRMQFARSDQLPGEVQLARERLVERLRGVSISSNRQSSRLTSGIPWDEFTYNDDFRLVDAGDWEVEAPADWLGRDTPSSDSSLTDMLPSLPNFCPQRPRGLNQAELNHLRREVYTTNDNDNDDDVLVFQVVLECSICLDCFRQGDDLVCLPCNHKFHSVCLYPWVQICGDCPNCRAGALLSQPKTIKEA